MTCPDWLVWLGTPAARMVADGLSAASILPIPHPLWLPVVAGAAEVLHAGVALARGGCTARALCEWADDAVHRLPRFLSLVTGGIGGGLGADGQPTGGLIPPDILRGVAFVIDNAIASCRQATSTPPRPVTTRGPLVPEPSPSIEVTVVRNYLARHPARSALVVALAEHYVDAIQVTVSQDPAADLRAGLRGQAAVDARALSRMAPALSVLPTTVAQVAQAAQYLSDIIRATGAAPLGRWSQVTAERVVQTPTAGPFPVAGVVDDASDTPAQASSSGVLVVAALLGGAALLRR